MANGTVPASSVLSGTVVDTGQPAPSAQPQPSLFKRILGAALLGFAAGAAAPTPGAGLQAGVGAQLGFQDRQRFMEEREELLRQQSLASERAERAFQLDKAQFEEQKRQFDVQNTRQQQLFEVQMRDAGTASVINTLRKIELLDQLGFAEDINGGLVPADTEGKRVRAQDFLNTQVQIAKAIGGRIEPLTPALQQQISAGTLTPLSYITDLKGEQLHAVFVDDPDAPIGLRTGGKPLTIPVTSGFSVQIAPGTPTRMVDSVFDAQVRIHMQQLAQRQQLKGTSAKQLGANAVIRLLQPSDDGTPSPFIQNGNIQFDQLLGHIRQQALTNPLLPDDSRYEMLSGAQEALEQMAKVQGTAVQVLPLNIQPSGTSVVRVPGVPQTSAQGAQQFVGQTVLLRIPEAQALNLRGRPQAELDKMGVQQVDGGFAIPFQVQDASALETLLQRGYTIVQQR